MIVKTNDFGQYGILKTLFIPIYEVNGFVSITGKSIIIRKETGSVGVNQIGIVFRNNTQYFPCKSMVVKARKTVDMDVILSAYLYGTPNAWTGRYNYISKEWKYYTFSFNDGHDIIGTEIQLLHSDSGAEVEISEIYFLPYIPESLENVDKTYLTADSEKLMEEMN